MAANDISNQAKNAAKAAAHTGRFAEKGFSLSKMLENTLGMASMVLFMLPGTSKFFRDTAEKKFIANTFLNPVFKGLGGALSVWTKTGEEAVEHFSPALSKAKQVALDGASRVIGSGNMEKVAGHTGKILEYGRNIIGASNLAKIEGAGRALGNKVKGSEFGILAAGFAMAGQTVLQVKNKTFGDKMQDLKQMQQDLTGSAKKPSTLSVMFGGHNLHPLVKQARREIFGFGALAGATVTLASGLGLSYLSMLEPAKKEASTALAIVRKVSFFNKLVENIGGVGKKVGNFFTKSLMAKFLYVQAGGDAIEHVFVRKNKALDAYRELAKFFDNPNRPPDAKAPDQLYANLITGLNNDMNKGRDKAHLENLIQYSINSQLPPEVVAGNFSKLMAKVKLPHEATKGAVVSHAEQIAMGARANQASQLPNADDAVSHAERIARDARMRGSQDNWQNTVTANRSRDGVAIPAR